jgi:hypothetical protein
VKLLEVFKEGHILSPLLVEEGRLRVHIETNFLDSVASIIVHSHHYLSSCILFLASIVFNLIELF